MADISLAEFAVYGFVAYSSLLMLIISIVKEIPSTKIMAIVRSIFLMPGMVAAGVLASSGVNIQVASVTTNNLIKSINTTQVWSENTAQINNIVLQSPVWQMFHLLIFLTLLTYVIWQMLLVFTKYDEAKRAV